MTKTQDALIACPNAMAQVAAGAAITGPQECDASAFARRLVVDHGVAVAPGSTFGPAGTGSVRLSLASAEDVIEEGVARIDAAVRDWERTRHDG